MAKVLILPQFHDNGIVDKIWDQNISDESQLDVADLDLFITISKSQYLIAKFLEENPDLPVIAENYHGPIPEALFLQKKKDAKYLFPTGKLPSDYDMLTFEQKTWLSKKGAYVYRLLSDIQLHGFYDHPDSLADSTEGKENTADTHSNYLINLAIIQSREYRLLAHANNIANVSGADTVAAIFGIGHKFNPAIKCFSDITIEFVDFKVDTTFSKKVSAIKTDTADTDSQEYCSLLNEIYQPIAYNNSFDVRTTYLPARNNMDSQTSSSSTYSKYLEDAAALATFSIAAGYLLFGIFNRCRRKTKLSDEVILSREKLKLQ
jgi:hypothetical protein